MKWLVGLLAAVVVVVLAVLIYIGQKPDPYADPPEEVAVAAESSGEVPSVEDAGLGFADVEREPVNSAPVIPPPEPARIAPPTTTQSGRTAPVRGLEGPARNAQLAAQLRAGRPTEGTGSGQGEDPAVHPERYLSHRTLGQQQFFRAVGDQYDQILPDVRECLGARAGRPAGTIEVQLSIQEDFQRSTQTRTDVLGMSGSQLSSPEQACISGAFGTIRLPHGSDAASGEEPRYSVEAGSAIEYFVTYRFDVEASE